jgi:condensin complex subunit 2
MPHLPCPESKKALASEGGSKRPPRAEADLDFRANLDLAQLFQPSAAPGSLLLKLAKPNHLLPEDLGYASKDMFRLFLKPFPLLPTESGGASGPAALVASLSGWDGRQEEEGAADLDAEAMYEGPGDCDEDDEDHPLVDVDASVERGGHDYSAQGILPHHLHYGTPLSEDFPGLDDQRRRPKAAPIRYAKIAKRVDVQRLKDDIWHCLSDTMHPRDPAGSDSLATPVPFTGVRNTVADAAYQNTEDVTVPFYFICLLHLANEKHLAVQGNEWLDELLISPGA